MVEFGERHLTHRLAFITLPEAKKLWSDLKVLFG